MLCWSVLCILINTVFWICDVNIFSFLIYLYIIIIMLLIYIQLENKNIEMLSNLLLLLIFVKFSAIYFDIHLVSSIDFFLIRISFMHNNSKYAWIVCELYCSDLFNLFHFCCTISFVLIIWYLIQWVLVLCLFFTSYLSDSYVLTLWNEIENLLHMFYHTEWSH